MPEGGMALFRAGDTHQCPVSVFSKMTLRCLENPWCLPQTASARRSGSMPESHRHNTGRSCLRHRRLFWVRSSGSSHYGASVRTNLLDQAELGLGHATVQHNCGIPGLCGITGRSWSLGFNAPGATVGSWKGQRQAGEGWLYPGVFPRGCQGGWVDSE